MDKASTPKEAQDKPGRAHNVVDALFQHFLKWKPEVLKNASSIQKVRQQSEGEGTQ